MDELNPTGGFFADDCVIYREVSHRREAEELQRDLETISEWTRNWQLSLNIQKCKVMVITNKRTTMGFKYCLNGTNLEWVNSFRYLGVSVDMKLRWNTHCHYIAAKSTRILNLLKRSMSQCSQQSKVTAYQALVLPHLECYAPVWNSYTAKNIEMLEKIQKRAARWITATCKWNNNAQYWDKSYHQSLSELKWQLLHRRWTYLTHCQTFKVLNHMDYSLHRV